MAGRGYRTGSKRRKTLEKAREHTVLKRNIGKERKGEEEASVLNIP